MHTNTLLKGRLLLDSAVAGVRALRLLNMTSCPPTNTHTHLYVDLSSNARAFRMDERKGM